MEFFERLTTLEEAEQLIEGNNVAFLYISQENCSVCHGLKPQVKKVMDQYPKIQAAEIRNRLCPGSGWKVSYLYGACSFAFCRRKGISP